MQSLRDNFTAQVVVAIIAILCLVGIVGRVAYTSFSTDGPVPVRTATSDWLERIARQSGGDYNKLSPVDKAKLDQIPFGGKIWLKRKYDSLH